jgi:hypothetical protein
MRLIFSFLFCIIFQIQLSAQKEAYNWIWGTCFPEFGCDGIDDGLNGTGIMKFNDDSLESITTKYFPAPFTKGSATISDSLGNFLMAFNGKTLFDSSGNVISELTDLDYDDIIVGYRGFLFLKPRINDGYYYLINSYSGNFTNSPNPFNVGIDTLFSLTKIKIDNVGYNVEETIRFDLPISTVPGGIDACRHANGRDWWFLKLGQRKNQYIRGLLSPDTLTLEPYYTNQDSAYTNFAWASFSSDGSKYVHWFGGHIRELQVFDFDRCTGELSNLQTYDFSDIVIDEWFTDFTPFSLSPDGTKLYMVKTNADNFQIIDNIQFDLLSQEVTQITDSTGVFLLTPNLKHAFGAHTRRLEPQGPFVPFVSVLLKPNEIGLACEYQPMAIELPAYAFPPYPINWANHLLGPIDGTICDSLGLNDETAIKEIKQFSFNIFPNPGQNELNFKTDLPLPVNAIIRDNQGKVVFENNYNTQTFSITNGLSKLKSGLYFVELQSIKNQQRLSRKWMKLD